MKDLEKIKSEDLACQVADANPGNFAIEQEVAQLVGATVPAPTEPSADDARELGAQLLVFLRRALTPIQTALRTALAAIYAHLDSRCTAYTPAAYDPFRLPAGPYDPMRPLTPRTLPNLLTALTAFSARKISNGSAPNDGIPDGISLAHLICSTAAANAVTEIKDDNYGYVMDKAPSNAFPNAKKVTLRCKTLHAAPSAMFPNAEEFYLPELDHIDTGESGAPQVSLFYGASIKKIDLSGVKRLRVVNASYSGLFYNITSPCEVLSGDCDSVISVFDNNYPRLFHTTPGIIKWTLGNINTATNLMTNGDFINLMHFEIKGASVSLNLTYWTATNCLDASRTDLIEQGSTAQNNLQQFLSNFKTYIALRLTANGSGKTLTLSQAVRDAIHAAEATYGIEAIIVTQKGWTLSPAPTA